MSYGKKVKVQRRVFSIAFKKEVVRQVMTQGIVIAEFGKSVGLNESVLRRWIKQFGSNTGLTSIATDSANLADYSAAALEIEKQKSWIIQNELDKKKVIDVLFNLNQKLDDQK